MEAALEAEAEDTEDAAAEEAEAAEEERTEEEEEADTAGDEAEVGVGAGNNATVRHTSPHDTQMNNG